jgi:hypothetical protein
VLSHLNERYGDIAIVKDLMAAKSPRVQCYKIVNPPYETVFDISQKSFDWWFPASGVFFVVVGTVLIAIGKRARWTGFRGWTGYIFVSFASLWTLTMFERMSYEYFTLHNAARNGRYSIIVGEVRNFDPMPYDGHQEECFSVKDATFCYSDFEETAAFNNTASHGGPIRAGLPVRITYVGNHILRIEVRQGQSGVMGGDPVNSR